MLYTVKFTVCVAKIAYIVYIYISMIYVWVTLCRMDIVHWTIHLFADIITYIIPTYTNFSTLTFNTYVTYSYITLTHIRL